MNAALLASGPAVCGLKLMLRLQLAPGASAKLLVQSAGVPEPATWTKFGARDGQAGTNGIQWLVADVLRL